MKVKYISFVLLIISYCYCYSEDPFSFKDSLNQLKSIELIDEFEKSIRQNGHLPGIPSAEEVKDNGINISDMQAKMLEKIEELTLHMIELKKENEQLKQEINKLK